MAQLKSIIGSILRDIISAQHEANLYAVSLGECYGKDGKAKGFELPNIMFSDIEMDLRYAVTSADSSQEQSNISYSKFRKFLSTLCTEAARTAITEGISSVLYSNIARNESDKDFFLRLKQDQELYKSFHSFLRKNMKMSFDNGLYESIDNSSGCINEDKVISRLMNTVRSKFLDDSDLYTLFSGADGKELKRQCEENISKALGDIVRKQSEGQNFKRTKDFAQLEVEVNASQLEKLPQSAIQNFRFRFSPAETPITMLDQEEELDDFDMK